MELRMLGRSGLKVSPLCLGGNVFGWTIDEKRSIELLNAFVAAGFNFIDTADVYSTWVPGHQGGESEAIIGNWMKSRPNRASVVIATKVGMEMRGQKGLSKAHILASVEGSSASRPITSISTSRIRPIPKRRSRKHSPPMLSSLPLAKCEPLVRQTTRPCSSAPPWRQARDLNYRAMKAYSPNTTFTPARLTSKNSSPSVASTALG